MYSKNRLVTLLTMVVAAATLENCTDSPLDEKISGQPRQISGFVDIVEEDEDNDTFVWLEGFEIGTRTQEDGSFELEIPNSLSNGLHTGLNGIYHLYFYIANYAIETVEIVIRDGKIVYGEGGLTDLGDLREPVKMRKILNVRTIVEPKSVQRSYRGPMNVMVTLQAPQDTIEVIYPKSVGGLLGAILILEKSTQNVFIDIPDVGAEFRDLETVGPEPKSRRMVFSINGADFRALDLLPGDYKVIPYFLVVHDNLPQALLETIGPNVEELNESFLRIPYIREGGDFSVAE